MKLTCSLCHHVIQGERFQYQEGWAKQREKGTNALRLKITHNRFACRSCIERAERGIATDQNDLFAAGNHVTGARS